MERSRSIQHGWGKCPLSKEERGDIILFLSKDEEKMLVYRPRLIQNRWKAATLYATEHQGQFSMNILLDLILHSQQNQIRQKRL